MVADWAWLNIVDPELIWEFYLAWPTSESLQLGARLLRTLAALATQHNLEIEYLCLILFVYGPAQICFAPSNRVPHRTLYETKRCFQLLTRTKRAPRAIGVNTNPNTMAIDGNGADTGLLAWSGQQTSPWTGFPVADPVFCPTSTHDLGAGLGEHAWNAPHRSG